MSGVCVCALSSQLCPEDLSPAGCSANALATGSDPEPATEPSKGPVARQSSVTWSAETVREQLREQGDTPKPSILRRPAMIFAEQQKQEFHEHVDGLVATPPARKPALKRQVASWT